MFATRIVGSTVSPDGKSPVDVSCARSEGLAQSTDKTVVSSSAHARRPEGVLRRSAASRNCTRAPRDVALLSKVPRPCNTHSPGQPGENARLRNAYPSLQPFQPNAAAVLQGGLLVGRLLSADLDKHKITRDHCLSLVSLPSIVGVAYFMQTQPRFHICTRFLRVMLPFGNGFRDAHSEPNVPTNS